MNSAGLVVITLVWIVFAAKDFPYRKKSKDKKENILYFAFHGASLLFYLFVLFNYRPPMPIRWLNETLGDLVMSIIGRME